MPPPVEKPKKAKWGRWVALVVIGLVIGFEVVTLLAARNTDATSDTEYEENWSLNEGHTIQNNLREIAMAARQYMMDKGVDHVAVRDLWDGNYKSYMHSISPVCGEKYDDIVITRDMKFLSIKVPDGHFVAYRLTPGEMLAPGPTSPAR